MNLDELATRLEITETIVGYTRYGDAGRIDDFLSRFAPDGVLETKGRVAKGPSEIKNFVAEVGQAFSADAAFLPARHHLASVWIDLHGHDRAEAGSYFALIAANGLDHWGTYRDQLSRVDGHWRFTHRRVRLEGARPGSPVAWMVESPHAGANAARTTTGEER